MRNVTILLAVLAVVALSAPAFGNEIWTGDVSEDWGDPNNWSNGMVPGAADAAQIDGFTALDPLITADAGTVSYLFGGMGVRITSGGVLTAKKSQLYNAGNAVNPGGVTVSGTGIYHTGTWGFEGAGDWGLTVVGSNCTVDVAGNWIIKWSGAGTLRVKPDNDGSKLSTITVAGDATLAGGLVLDASGYAEVLNAEIVIMSVVGTLDTTLFTDFTVVGGKTSDWQLTRTDGVGGSIVAKVVPEPMTLTLLGVGLVGVILRRKRA